jgi:hypothetical protein
MGEIHRMERDAEGLEENCGRIVDLANRKTGGSRDNHPLDKTSVVRVESTEVHRRAEVGITP